VNPLDAGLCVIALVSVAAGALRGFVREAAALAGWIVAVVLVLNLAHGLGERLPFGTGVGVGAGGIRTAIAALLIVVACILGASLVGRLLRAALTAAKLGGPDRALGALFGAIRAAAVSMVVAVIVLHAGLAQRPFWKSSRAAPWLEAALRFASPGIIPAAGRPASVTGV
jgi:membrane protein required for colicin V production